MKRVDRAWLAGVAAICTFVWTGCQPAAPPAAPKAEMHADDDHDHDHDHGHDHAHEHADHEHGESFADEFSELEGADASVEGGVCQRRHRKGPHAAVHDAGHTIDELKELADKSDLPADKKAELQAAIKDLFDCYELIDNKLEGNTGSSYDEVSERIAADIEVLRTEAHRQEQK